MDNVSVTFIWFGFFAAVFLGWYFYIKARNNERIALIEKGADVSEIYKKREFKFRFPWLKFGIISFGFASGWLFAFILVRYIINDPWRSAHSDRDAFIAGIIFLFTAISILIANFVDKPKTNK